MVRVARTGKTQPGVGASPGRQVAYQVVRRVADGAYADRALRAEAERAGLTGADRAFAQALAYGTVQRRRTLDYVIAMLSARPLESLDPPLLDALRIGVYQLLFMGSVPDHAAVTESVELAKGGGGAGHRFANAVLRRAAREAPALLLQLTDDGPADAAILHSHPAWLVRMWWDALGREETVALLERDNEPAEDALRVTELTSSAAEVTEALVRQRVRSAPAADLPEGLVLGSSFDIEGSRLFRSGAITPQSRASMLVSRALGPQPGERVLDMCAAPGAKTTHIAALMRGEGEVVAVEQNEARADALRENIDRMHAGATARVVVADAREVTGRFDRVLLDAPCSNLGTLAARPDARWRRQPGQIDELAELQVELLDAADACVRPGGVLVYSVCTISPREGEEQIAKLTDRRPGLHVASTRQTLPHRDGTDGFFMARLRRTT
jgi:16S rRNA (cytosine967-C5)-methyltransferase